MVAWLAWKAEAGGGDCSEEVDGKCWLVIGICSLRRITLSLETMEARVTTEWSRAVASLAMVALRWSRRSEEGSQSTIGAQ